MTTICSNCTNDKQTNKLPTILKPHQSSAKKKGLANESGLMKCRCVTRWILLLFVSVIKGRMPLLGTKQTNKPTQANTQANKAGQMNVQTLASVPKPLGVFPAPWGFIYITKAAFNYSTGLIWSTPESQCSSARTPRIFFNLHYSWDQRKTERKKGKRRE